MKRFYPKNPAPISGTRLACAALLALTVGIAGGASAQPRGGGGQGGPGGARFDRDAMMSKRMTEAIEAKTRKPLTTAQKKKLDAAIKTRSAANKAANDKFMAQVSSITGLKAGDLRGMGRMGRGMGGPSGQGGPGGGGGGRR